MGHDVKCCYCYLRELLGNEFKQIFNKVALQVNLLLSIIVFDYGAATSVLSSQSLGDLLHVQAKQFDATNMRDSLSLVTVSAFQLKSGFLKTHTEYNKNE